MDKLTVADLWPLEEYVEARTEFRKKVIARKKDRTVRLGPNMTLLFEDRMLIQYQVQEMLRLERISEKAAVQEELDAYNPLIPDGSNWKATCLIEFEDEGALQKLKGIERRVWAQAGQLQKCIAIADEDMDRASEDEAAAVHFLRFELDAATVAALKKGAALRLGVDHPGYGHAVAVGAATHASLLNDLK